ncbi:hypothetical protein RYX36_035942, partial [Vicia faba]
MYLLNIKCRKDFDADREIELEKHEKCRKSVESNHEEDEPEVNYPKGLLIAFKLKSISEEVPSEKNSTDEQANGNNGAAKTDEQNPSEVAAATEDSDQKMSENDANDKENNGVNEEKDAEGKEKEQENKEVKEEKAEVEEKGMLELYKKSGNGVNEGKATE